MLASKSGAPPYKLESLSQIRYSQARWLPLLPMTLLAKTLLILFSCVVVIGGLAACAPLTVINALTPSSTYQRSTGIAYGNDPRQKLDIYVPRHLAGQAPVVVFFYGGSWNSGDRGDYAFVGEALASRGIIAVLVDYRLYPQVRYPAFIEDSARAVAWVAAHIQRYGGDPGHLFVMGHSAGAYNAAMIALDSRWLAEYGLTPASLRGWIGLAGPYDFIPIKNEEVRPIFFYPDTPPESQPIHHVTASAPRALLIAPRHDKLVDPVRNTGGLAKRLRTAGADVKEIYIDNVSHTTLIAALFWPLRGWAPVLDMVDRFVMVDRESAVHVPATAESDSRP
jgi:acetyl esterase/lipase